MGIRVLIIAENASARFGGEAALPLHMFREMRARGMEVWLITHERTRKELEADFPAERGRMRFVPDTWVHRLLFAMTKLLPHRISSILFDIPSHMLTQWVARRMGRKLVADEKI